MSLFSESTNYIFVSITMDALAACVMLSLLLCIFGSPKHNAEIRRHFAVCLLTGVFACAVDALTYVFFGDVEHRTAFALSCYIDVPLTYLMTMFKARLIFFYIGTDKAINRVIHSVVHYIYASIILISLIPPLFSYALYIPEGKAEMESGPWMPLYYAVSALAGILVLFALCYNYKKIGIKYSLILFFLQLGPGLLFSFFSSDEPPMLVGTALFIMIAYILVYQEQFNDLLKQDNKPKEKEIEIIQNHYEVADMKAKITLSQIQPHFIYNTLTAIAYLCRSDSRQAEKLTLRFARYLRNNIEVLSATEPIPFSKELENIENYLCIEKCRFEDRINVEYDIRVSDFCVPVLTLQPIVENAVKHGICKREEGGTIWISTYEDENRNFIEIKNNGMGVDMETIENDGKEHVGLKNVTSRIKAVGGTIVIDSQPDVGTTVTVQLPKENALC